MNYQEDFLGTFKKVPIIPGFNYAGTLNKEPAIPGFNYSDLKKYIVSEEIGHPFVFDITPSLAQTWLETRNTLNRKICKDAFERIKQTMIKNEWKDSPPISFDWNGSLIDGQHRLKAIAATGKTIRLKVIFGVDPTYITCYDRGTIRTRAQLAQLAGLEWVTNKITKLFNNIFVPTCFGTHTLTEKEYINGLCSIRKGIEFTKSVSDPYIQSVIVRAFYSKKVKNKTLLIDFMLFLNNKDINKDEALFPNASLNLSSIEVIKLNRYFDKQEWQRRVDKKNTAEASRIKFRVAQFYLSKFLSQKTSKRIFYENQNLFPVRFLDELLFKDWETIPDDIEKYC